MSRDRLLGPWLAKVHPRFGTPYRATILTGIAVATLAALIPIGDAADMTNIGTFFAFVLVCLGVMILRYTKPDQRVRFAYPSCRWSRSWGCWPVSDSWPALPQLTWIRFGVWTIVGIVVYLLYSMKHSKLANPSLEARSTLQ